MNKVRALMLGLALTATFSGCCCGWPGSGYSSNYGCPGGNCAPGITPGYPQTGYYGGTNATVQTQMVAPSPVAYGAPVYQPYPTTAFAPLESLPTY